MKRLMSVLTVLVLLLSFALPAWADTALTSSEETQNLQKAYYNSDYAYLEDPDSVFSALTLEEAIYLFRQEGNYLLLLGGSWCGNTTPVIGYIDQVAKESTRSRRNTALIPSIIWTSVSTGQTAPPTFAKPTAQAQRALCFPAVSTITCMASW